MADADKSQIVHNDQWNMPLSDAAPVYPFNNTERTISGHVFEVDDTPGAERLHREHKSGTYETVDATGGRAVNVVGDSYTVVAKDDYVEIRGSANVNIGDTCRLVVGSLEIAVRDTYRLTVGGKSVVEYGGGLRTDIIGDSATNISGSVNKQIHGHSNLKIYDGAETTVSGDSSTNITGNFLTTTNGSTIFSSSQNSTFVASNNFTIAANRLGLGGGAGEVHVDAADLNIASNVKVKGNATVEGTVDGGKVIQGNIELETHIHGLLSTTTKEPTG